ncbi:hypothetical protein DM790_05990 [Flavobacterium collinsii]|jgi:hypothetical protein|nr:hypothetical protein [Flavobacterium collinsii]
MPDSPNLKIRIFFLFNYYKHTSQNPYLINFKLKKSYFSVLKENHKTFITNNKSSFAKNFYFCFNQIHINTLNTYKTLSNKSEH